jgi:microcystin-dependent protein
MSDPYLSEIRMFGFGFAPKGWQMCNGQTLPINQYQALFALIGTYYGGNGSTNFMLPNLQGSVPMHSGNNVVLGEKAGVTSVTLITQQIPTHTHFVRANTTANAPAPSNTAVPGGGGPQGYGATPNTAMNPNIVGTAGNNLPHSNMQPYLVLNFCIAMTGLFPSRN